jgi:hypothetical protein
LSSPLTSTSAPLGSGQFMFVVDPTSLFIILLAVIVVILIVVLIRRKPPPASESPTLHLSHKQTRYCTSCGAALQPGKAFCGSCGVRAE